jgi:16S rRNA (cytosine1402-N4)-methyltransferase
MDTPPAGHEPVLVREVREILSLRAGQTLVDCTLGRAGHASILANDLGPTGLLIGIDADPRNLEFARQRLRDAPCRARFFHANFAQLPQVMAAASLEGVDAVLADLGLSTNQLFDPRYGLSFASAMPLDMRIDPDTERSAADLVNKLSESELANVLYQLAQERYSRRIARKIVEARRVSPILTTERLAELVRSVLPKSPRRRGGPKHSGQHPQSPTIDPATRTFLALRMAVNQESGNLHALLEAAPKFLRPEGRLAVISFQSTEDRVVKQAFASAQRVGLLKILTPKPLSPAADELVRNPRSRSAKLRGAQRMGTQL